MTGFYYTLSRVDDDGSEHLVELDDFQVCFETFFSPQLGVTIGKFVIGLSGQQVEDIKKWWKEP